MANVSFSGLNLSGVKIPGANLTSAFVDYTDFSGSDLTGANLKHAVGLDTMKTKDALVEITKLTKSQDKSIKIDSVIKALAFHPKNAEIVAIGCKDGSIRIYDWIEEEQIMTLQEHSRAVLCLDYSKDGKYLASGGDDSKAFIWDTSSYEIMHTLSGIPNGVTAVRFSLDSKKLFTSNGEEGSLFICDTENG
mmetsp:Transcript_7066/g.6316  ORF Transcript_7066/g.6316 Transcript_7066/m.6316 type:complete len:192 (-) Transcript_7066:1122-1697(-)